MVLLRVHQRNQLTSCQTPSLEKLAILELLSMTTALMTRGLAVSSMKKPDGIMIEWGKKGFKV